MFKLLFKLSLLSTVPSDMFVRLSKARWRPIKFRAYSDWIRGQFRSLCRYHLISHRILSASWNTLPIGRDRHPSSTSFPSHAWNYRISTCQNVPSFEAVSREGKLTDFETTLVQLACPDQCPGLVALARVWQVWESSCRPLSILPSDVL